MGRPRSNEELARSGHTALGEHARVSSVDTPQQDDGPVGPVPPGNPRGHRPADDSDSPDPSGPCPEEAVLLAVGGQPTDSEGTAAQMAPATVAAVLRLGSGFAAAERSTLVDLLSSMDPRLATCLAGQAALELSVKQRNEKAQAVTLQCWIAGRPRMVASSSQPALAAAVAEVRDNLRRQLDDAKTRTEPGHNRQLRAAPPNAPPRPTSEQHDRPAPRRTDRRPGRSARRGRHGRHTSAGGGDVTRPAPPADSRPAPTGLPAAASQVTGMHPLTSIESGGWWPAHDRVDWPASDAEGVRIDVHHDRTPPLVRVSGELDITAVPLLVALLDHARRRHPFVRGGLQQRTPPDLPVDVDLSQVTFADSHGLAPILNGAATVVSASTCVRRLLELLEQLSVEPPWWRHSA